MSELFNLYEQRSVRASLRHNSTEAETTLWQHLRNRRLAGAKFRRQYGIGQFVVDFYCNESRLVVELDGSIHDPDEQRAYDATRQQILVDIGCHVLRFTNDDVLTYTDHVLRKIADAL
jgi:very-short-patch-repair endonuclease